MAPGPSRTAGGSLTAKPLAAERVRDDDEPEGQEASRQGSDEGATGGSFHGGASTSHPAQKITLVPFLLDFPRFGTVMPRSGAELSDNRRFGAYIRRMDPLAAVDLWPVDHVGVAVVGADGVLATRGLLDRPFPLASVTKLLTAMAVLVAVEEGTVALDDEAGPEGATVAHLLAHASGLGIDGARHRRSRPAADLLQRRLRHPRPAGGRTGRDALRHLRHRSRLRPAGDGGHRHLRLPGLGRPRPAPPTCAPSAGSSSPPPW